MCQMDGVISWHFVRNIGNQSSEHLRVLISGFLLELRNSDMKPNIPFFPLDTVVLRERFPLEVDISPADELWMLSASGGDGDSTGSV